MIDFNTVLSFLIKFFSNNFVQIASIGFGFVFILYLILTYNVFKWTSFIFNQIIDIMGLHIIDMHPIAQDIKKIPLDFLCNKSLILSISLDNFNLDYIDKNKIITESGEYLNFLYSHNSIFIHCNAFLMSQNDLFEKFAQVLSSYRNTNAVDLFVINISLKQLSDIQLMLDLRKKMTLFNTFNTPTLLIIDDLETIDGINHFFELLSEDEKKLIFGYEEKLQGKDIKSFIDDALDNIQLKFENLVHYKLMTLSKGHNSIHDLPNKFRQKAEGIRQGCHVLFVENIVNQFQGVFFTSLEKSIFLENLFMQRIASTRQIFANQRGKFTKLTQITLIVILLALLGSLPKEFIDLRSSTDKYLNEIRYLSTISVNNESELSFNNIFYSISWLNFHTPSSYIIPIGWLDTYHLKNKTNNALELLYNKIIIKKIIKEYNNKILMCKEGKIFDTSSLVFTEPFCKNNELANLYRYCMQVKLLEEMESQISSIESGINTLILQDIILRLFEIKVNCIPDHIATYKVQIIQSITLKSCKAEILDHFKSKLKAFIISFGSLDILNDTLDTLQSNIQLMEKSFDIYKDEHFIELYESLLKIEKIFKFDNVDDILSEGIIRNKYIDDLCILIKKTNTFSTEYEFLFMSQILEAVRNIKKKITELQFGLVQNFFVVDDNQAVKIDESIEEVIKLIYSMYKVAPIIIESNRIKYNTDNIKPNYLWDDVILKNLISKFAKYDFYRKTNAFNAISKDFRQFFVKVLLNLYKEIIVCDLYEAKQEKYYEISLNDKLNNFLSSIEYFIAILDFIDTNKLQNLNYIRNNLEDDIIKLLEDILFEALNNKLILEKKDVVNVQKYRLYKFLLNGSEASDIDILLKNLLECESLDQLESTSKYINKIKGLNSEFSLKLKNMLHRVSNGVIQIFYKQKFYAIFPIFMEKFEQYKHKFPIARDLSLPDLTNDEIEDILMIYRQNKEWMAKGLQSCSFLEEEWVCDMRSILRFCNFLDKMTYGLSSWDISMQNEPNAASKYLENVRIVIESDKTHSIDLLNNKICVNNPCKKISIFIKLIDMPGKVICFSKNQNTYYREYVGQFALMRLVEDLKKKNITNIAKLDLSKQMMVDSNILSLILYLNINFNDDYYSGTFI